MASKSMNENLSATDAQFFAAAPKPYLLVWGDNLSQSDLWKKLRVAPDTYRTALLANGGTADLLDLPAQGIRGNSHMLMMGRNSDLIAERIQGWMTSKGLMK